MLLNYRITVSGLTLIVKAKGEVEAVNKVLRTPEIQDHLSKLLPRYARFQVSVDSATP